MTDERNNLPSASSLSRLIACPGSVALINSLRTESPAVHQSEDAEFGSDVHAVLSAEVSEMSVPERAAWVASQCAKIRDRILREIFGEDQDLKMYVETRFWLSDHAGNKVFSAKPDLIAGKNGVFVYLEYKSLTGFVDPVDENAQILSGCVAFADDDETRNANGDTEVVAVYGALIQPLLGHKANLVKFDVADLMRGKRLILQKIDEAKAIGAPRIPGRHCVWCRARTICPENAADLMAIEKRGTFSIDLTPEMVAKAIPLLAPIKKRIKDIEAHAKRLAENGELPGYEVREQQGARKVAGQEQVQAIRNALADYVEKDELLKLLTLPLGQLREVFITKYVAANRCSKIDAGEEFDNIITPLCQRENPKRILTKKTS